MAGWARVILPRGLWTPAPGPVRETDPSCPYRVAVRKFGKALLFVGLALATLVAAYLGWLAWVFFAGTNGTPEEYAQAQSMADVVYADYPVEVIKYRHFSFIKNWEEITIAAIEDRDLQATISPYLDEAGLERSRVELKIARDGEVGAPWWYQAGPTPSPDAASYWRVSGHGPEADFGTHDPYDWGASTVTIGVYSAELYIGAADAPIITEALGGVAEHLDQLDAVLLYHDFAYGDPTTGVHYRLTPDAARSPTLAGDLDLVANGGTVPGITLLQR